jgi:hypothetical protein
VGDAVRRNFCGWWSRRRVLADYAPLEAAKNIRFAYLCFLSLIDPQWIINFSSGFGPLRFSWDCGDDFMAALVRRVSPRGR